MAEEPDDIRNGIGHTRTELTRDVDRLTDKTSPTRVARRRWTAVKEKVMGTPRHAAYSGADTARSATGTVQDAAYRAGDRATEVAHSAAGTVREAPERVARTTQGNPLAAGVIAFGVGMLTAALIPASDVEERAGQRLRDNADEILDQVREPAREVADDLKGSVKDAAGQVADTAKDAAQTTATRARESTQDAARDTRQAVNENR
jgi:hypothetical protein